jgi:hypothetical protein
MWGTALEGTKEIRWIHRIFGVRLGEGDYVEHVIVRRKGLAWGIAVFAWQLGRQSGNRHAWNRTGNMDDWKSQGPACRRLQVWPR